MARKLLTSDPNDDALMSLVDDDASTDAAVRNHAASCIRCTQRIEGLRATRRLLQDAAMQELRPQRDIAQHAVGRLRIRQTAVGNINEVFAAVRALMRGLTDLFGGGPPADKHGSFPRHDEGAPHG